MYNGNVQQNLLCVESCVTKEFSMSPLFSSTGFDPDANSVLLRGHLCTAVDSMRRKPCVRNCSRKREGLLNGNLQQNPLCAASCVTKDIRISPRFSPAFFYRDANSVLLLAHFCTAVLIRSIQCTRSVGRPDSSEVPRNPLTRWDVSSIPANGTFLTKKLKN